MEPLTNELRRLSLDDSAHSMTDEEENCLWTSLAHKKYSSLDKYLDGKDLPHEQVPEKIHKSQVLHAMGKYLHCHLPPETTLKILAQKIDLAREVIRKRDYRGTPDKVVNRLAGPKLSHVTFDWLRCEAALRTSGKEEQRLERYRSIEERAQNFDIDAEYKRGFQPNSPLQESEIKKESFTEFFLSAGLPWIEVSAASTRGKRTSMEDTLTVGTIQVEGKVSPFVVLFDGHGGDKVAQWLAENFKGILQDQCSLLGKPLEQATPAEIENILTALSVKVAQELRKKIDYDESGATLLLGLVIGPSLFVVNVGDSRALLLTKNKTFQLTEDAIPSHQPFLAGLQKRGGKDSLLDGRCRGYYRCSDYNVVRSIELAYGKGMTSRGKVTRFKLVPGEPTAIIFACDGAFDSNTSRMIANEYRQQGTPEALVQKAFESGSHDNISVIVVKINGSLPLSTTLALPHTNEHQKACVLSAIVQKKFRVLNDYLCGDDLEAENALSLEDDWKQKFRENLVSYLSSPLPEEVSAETYLREFRKARRQIWKRSFIGTRHEIANRLVGPHLSRITDKQLRNLAVLLPESSCLQRIQPWEDVTLKERFDINVLPQLALIERKELSPWQIRSGPIPCDGAGQDAVRTTLITSKPFFYQNCTFDVQNEKIHVFGGICDFFDLSEVLANLDRFLPGIIKEDFLSLGKPPSEAVPNVIENILSILPIRVEQRRRTFSHDTNWGSELLLGIRIKNAVWAVKTNGFMGRLLVLQEKDTFQVTERPTSQKGMPCRAQVTRRVFESDKPMTFLMGSEQLFDTCTSRQIADEYRDKKTAEALIQKAYTTGSGNDLTAYVLEMKK